MSDNEVSADDLKLIWALDEHSSDRWSKHYGRLVGGRSLAGLSPADLVLDERNGLIDGLNAYRNLMLPLLDAWPKFTRQVWTKAELLQTWTWPGASNNTWTPLWAWLKQSSADENDPRSQRPTWSTSESYNVSAPVIVIPIAIPFALPNRGSPSVELPVLLEGYYRTTRFAHSAAIDAEIPVWFPA